MEVEDFHVIARRTAGQTGLKIGTVIVDDSSFGRNLAWESKNGGGWRVEVCSISNANGFHNGGSLMARPRHELAVPTRRIETLTDGIFAIAMTLLVLGIQVPTLPGAVTPAEFRTHVISILPQIFTYIVSFILLAVFWMNHHIFFIIKRANTTLLWINVFWLMSIAFVPFSTSMIGRYGQFQLSQLIFDLNIFIIGVLWYANWRYSSHKGFVDEKVMPYVNQISRANLSLPVVAVIAIMASFISPIGSIFIFLVFPVIFFFDTLSKRRVLKKIS
jgi:uncharacterized membrane protein